ncbi:MAG: hypothetical protein J4473_05735 [Candidatus Aenigmarchaeota archaeon]|nr:hypothetical protein [Candidatus Aenigmarchaeota archaeon]
MADPFAALIQTVETFGIYSFLLPWLLVFAIIYGLLVKVKPFGTEAIGTRISGIVAFVIALLVTIAAGPEISAFVANIFGGASIFIAGILVVILFLAMAGYDYSKLGENKYLLAFLIIVAILLFIASGGLGAGWIGLSLGSQTVALIFVLIIILAAVWFVTRPEAKAEATGGKPKEGG